MVPRQVHTHILCKSSFANDYKRQVFQSLKFLGSLRNKSWGLFLLFQGLSVKKKKKSLILEGPYSDTTKTHFHDMLQIYLSSFHGKIFRSFTLSFPHGYPVKSNGEDMAHFNLHNRRWSTSQKNGVWKSLPHYVVNQWFMEENFKGI